MKKAMLFVVIFVIMVCMFANVSRADEWIDEEGQKWIGNTFHKTYEEYVEEVAKSTKWCDVADLVVIGNAIADELEAEGYKMEVTFEDRTCDWNDYRNVCMEIRTMVQIEEVFRMIDYAEWEKAGRPAGEK